MPRALLVLVATAAASLLLAGCSSSGPETTTGSTSSVSTVPPAPTPAGLPFHYQFLGESSSPSFHVITTGSYTVAYVLKGSNQTPGCTMSLALVSSIDGSSQQVFSGVTLQPADTKQGSVQVPLTPADWHFQEGGGCSWDVTVTEAS